MKNTQVLTQRQQEKVNNLIGKKITVYLSLKKYTKVLKQGVDGLYVLHENTRVPVKPDVNALDVWYFTGLLPKDAVRIKRYKR